MSYSTIVLGGGCFWCTEAVFKELRGVLDVESGYSNGQAHAPSYDDVCTGTTGCNEVVKLVYDPAQVSTRELLEIFFVVHDPTTLNRQGNDVGTQYRSGLYVYSEAQRQQAEASRQAYETAIKQAGYGAITTEILAAPEFYYAEAYHQQYLAKNPGGYCGLGGVNVACPIGLAV
jgi:peptide-methionine (S)-S-oxide reductase